MRLIDADELRNEVDNYDFSEYSDYSNMIDMIDDASTIEAEPVKRGRWEVGGVCSECGFMHDDFAVIWFSYCPNCGARMDGDTNEEP